MQYVEVALEQLPGPAQVAAGPAGQPPPARVDLHRQLGEQRRAATNQVRARAAGRQLRQERQVGQLTEDDPQRLRRIGAGHGAGARSGARWPERIGHARTLAELGHAGSPLRGDPP
jgi:hypothetical protein